MSNLAVIEKELVIRENDFRQVLPPGMSPDRIIRTVMISLDMNNSLMRADMQSIMRSAMSAAVLGLEVDGVTGQGYLVPFKGKCQFLPGYKGFCAIAGRSKRTLEGFIVREGDTVKDLDEANGIFKYERKMGEEAKRKITMAVAVSRGQGLPTIVRAMSLDQLLEVREKSAGWRAKGSDSTWGTNFEAMCRKTPMRRLANDIPNISLQTAAALDTQHDLGNVAYATKDGVMIDGDFKDVTAPAPPPPNLTRKDYELVAPNGTKRDFGNITDFVLTCRRFISGDKAEAQRVKFVEANRAHLLTLRERHPDELAPILEAMDRIVPAAPSAPPPAAPAATDDWLDKYDSAPGAEPQD